MNQTKSPQIALFYNATLVVQRRAVSGVLRYANTCTPWNVTLNEIHEKPSVPTDCQGLILCAPRADELRKFLRLKLPLVVINVSHLSIEDRTLLRGIPFVDSDSTAFGVEAAKYFLKFPGRTSVYVGLPTGDTPWDLEREAAFVAHLRAHKQEALVYPRPQAPCSPTAEQAHLRAWLATLPRPLSIFAANDARARRVITACGQAGLTVPFDAAVLGADDDEWVCDATLPRLSSLASRAEEGGFEAARMLDELLSPSTGKKSKAAPPRGRTLHLPPTHVVERESTDFREVPNPFVSRALSFIRAQKGLNVRVSDVAAFVELSVSWIETLFQQELGTSVIDEIMRVRQKTLLSLILTTRTPFAEIAQLSGFTNASSLSRIIRSATGHTPSALRENPGLLGPSAKKW